MAASEKNREEIFCRAIEITDAAERAAFLDQACGTDRELRDKVEALLKAHERAGDFLAPPAGSCVTLDGPGRIEGPGTTIGRYELLDLLGEGGMGLVYLAEQKEPVRRRVALKIIKPGMDSKQVIARFEAERQALAVLDHPNIAHVFDAGCTETGRPYFVMEYVRGMSITRYCDDKKLTIEQRLRLFEQVCEGVQHAHQKGIIHRDLKPSNILVTMQGDRPVPKIIDFGIAKATTQSLTDATVFTYQGQLLGTPEYMSPEQVDLATQDIDTRSDIYSLGVVLYELLAGVLPFESESFTKVGLAEIQRTIREDEPASPSIRLTQMGDKAKGIAESRGTHVVPLARRLHRELEWIPLKAMRKDRCRRYRSASEMADDVRNYLNGLPLLAGPETAIYRVQKFVHKHAGSVATVALVAAAVVLGLVVSTTMYFRAEDSLQKETAARADAEHAKAAEQEQRSLAEQKAEQLRRTLYVNSIQLADAKHREGDTKRVKSLLASCPNDLRGWEWNRLNYISDQAIVTLRGASHETHPTFSPDGKLIASDGWGKDIKIWDAASGSELMNLAGHEGNVLAVAFSPDGQRLASGSADKTVKVWDVQSGRELRTLHGHGEEVCHVAFSPDGKRIASVELGGVTKIWDAVTGVAVTNIQRRAADDATGLGFSPDGRRIASGNKTSICVWDTTSGAVMMTIASAQKLWVTCVAYSPDGKSIVSCGWDSRIRVWDASTGKETMVLRSRSQRMDCVSYDSSGKLILARDQGNTIGVWDIVTREQLMTLAGHDAPVRSASFSRDGRRIVSGSGDRTIRVWDTSSSREQLFIRTPSWMAGLSYSPDGNRFVTGGPRAEAMIWDVATGAEQMSLSDHKSQVSGVAYSPDGRRIASGSSRGIVKIRDAATGAQLMSLGEHKADGKAIIALAFSPDGRNIVFGGDDEVIRVHNTKTGVELMRLAGPKDQVGSLAYNPDGTRIISGSWDGTARVWDAVTGTEVLTIRADRDTICGNVALSHDGRHIATGTYEGKVILWDAETGEEVKTWSAHTGAAQRIAFSPDDRCLASVSRTDSTVKVWDTATGTELITLVPQQDVYNVTFSPDGRTIAALCTDGAILWETAEPPGGYPLREAGQTARKLVEALCQKHGLYHDVVDELQVDRTCDEPARKLALQIANLHRWEDATKLNFEAWETVCAPDKGVEAYREALAKAQRANGWEPNDPEILNTLGVAQYRVGLYEDAFKTLTETDRTRTDANDAQPADVAFIAMSLHRLGRSEEARAALGRLRDLLKNKSFADDSEAKSLLAEAEGVITGTKK